MSRKAWYSDLKSPEPGAQNHFDGTAKQSRGLVKRWRKIEEWEAYRRGVEEEG